MVTQIMKASLSKLPESVSRLPPGAGCCVLCGGGAREAAKNQGGKGVDD
jgi:transposase